MEPAVFGQSFERRDFAFDAGGRSHARPCRDTVDDYRAGSALSEPATESRAAQSEVIAQDIEQRSGWVDIHRVILPIHLQCDVAHVALLVRSAVIIFLYFR